MSLRRTPLYDRHAAAGARFVEFGGWEMPVHYGDGIQAEHDAVRQRVGLFDVSHMGEIEIRGSGAVAAVDRLIANDLQAAEDGQAVYTPLCTPAGGIVDDLLVYRLAADHVFICCNASNREKDFAWIRDHLEGATAVDRGEDFAMLALQGRHAPAVLQPLTDLDLSALGRFRAVHAAVAGVPALVSRTGYTGEDGFELYVPADRAGAVWDALFAADPALRPIGLGARDTLRLEMKMCLYGQDIDETTTPLEAGLGWATKLAAGDFIGRDALLAQKAAGIPRRLVAFRLDGKAIARHGYPVVDAEGQPIGQVTSGTRSPTLGVPIGLAYVPTGQHAVGAPIRIQVRNRVESGVVVKPPFVRPGA